MVVAERQRVLQALVAEMVGVYLQVLDLRLPLTLVLAEVVAILYT